jgi:hypothetical protein
MSDNQADLRQQWIKHCKTIGNGTPWPPELHELRCGARTRAGRPCKRRDLYKSGRCRLHGGLSTGPKRGKPELTP